MSLILRLKALHSSNRVFIAGRFDGMHFYSVVKNHKSVLILFGLDDRLW